MRRRDLLISGVMTALTGSCGVRPGVPTGRAGAWVFFTPEEGAAVEALVDRLIPADETGPGGREAGCAVFIDRQLAGGYGRAERLYMRPPFAAGMPEQGLQSPLTPVAQYRVALRGLDGYSRAAFAQPVAALSPGLRDQLLTQLEHGQAKLDGVDGRAFFELLLENTMEGFFADPIYGGNKDMIGWKMLGFPGARYDYRDHIGKFNEPYPLPPVGIAGRPEWMPGA